MIVYRIVHKIVTQLFAGSGIEGRWCSGGRKVIYTSSSVALACLENILRRGGLGFSTDFKTVLYEIPDDIIILEVHSTDLDHDWRFRSNYAYCQSKGNTWYDKKDASILKVPSAIIPDEYNYLIKATAAGIDRIRIKVEKPFIPDERLENMLMSVDIKKLKKAATKKNTKKSN